MSSRRFALLPSVLGVLALAVAVPGLSQSYGPGDQTLTIGSAAFRPTSQQTDYSDAFGYIYGRWRCS